MNPLAFHQVDLSQLSFQPATKGRQGGSNLVVQYSGHTLCVQTPPLNLRFGITRWEEPYLKFTMDLSFKTARRLPAAAAFLDWYTHLDTVVKGAAVHNVRQWFKADLPASEVEGMFCSCLKHDASGRFEPNLRLNLGAAGGTCAVPFFAPDRQVMPVEQVTKGSDIMCVLELTGIWFYNRQWGLKWRVVQAAVAPPPVTPPPVPRAPLFKSEIDQPNGVITRCPESLFREETPEGGHEGTKPSV